MGIDYLSAASPSATETLFFPGNGNGGGPAGGTPPGSILGWDEDGVHAWMSGLGYPQYEAMFKENGITGELLVHLDHDALKDLGVHSVGQRLAILKAVYHVKIAHGVPVEQDHWAPPSEDLMSDSISLPDGSLSGSMSQLLSDRDERIRMLEGEVLRLNEFLGRFTVEFKDVCRHIGFKTPSLDYNPFSKVSASSSDPTSLYPTASGGSRFAPGERGANAVAATIAKAQGEARRAKDASSGNVSPTTPSPTRTTAPLDSAREGVGMAALSAGPPVTVSAAPSPVTSMSAHGATGPGMGVGGSMTSQAGPLSAASEKQSTPSSYSNYPEAPSTAPPNTASTAPPASEASVGASPLPTPSTSLAVAPSSFRSASSSSSSHPRRDASGSTADSLYKSFRVTLDDPCYKVLPAALKKYKINDDWRQYALFICFGNTERCLSYEDKPLLIFQKLKEQKQNPVFMLRHIRDVKSPIAIANAKAAARKAPNKSTPAATRSKTAGGLTPATATTDGPFTPSTAAISATGSASGSAAGAGTGKSGEEGAGGAETQRGNGEGASSRPPEQHRMEGPTTYAISIYPYVSERDDEFDVSVGDTFIVLSKAKGWWVVQRDPGGAGEGDPDEEEGHQNGWVPAGCLLETSTPLALLAAETDGESGGAANGGAKLPIEITAKTPIPPSYITSTSTPGVLLMDYVSPDDGLDLKKDDRLRVFKRYNHWSYAVIETDGYPRGWVPSWFIGKVHSSNSSSSASSQSQSQSSSATKTPQYQSASSSVLLDHSSSTPPSSSTTAASSTAPPPSSNNTLSSAANAGAGIEPSSPATPVTPSAATQPGAGPTDG